jgi:hypothetical protein
LGLTNGALVGEYWFFKIKPCVFYDLYLTILRKYLYFLLPENTLNSGRFIVNIQYVFLNWRQICQLFLVCVVRINRLCGQSFWLQIRRPGLDSRYYQKKKVVGLERGPLSLVSTTEELLDRKVAAPV